jgi:fructoselysine-6-P-deglycase FrlB-like protein
VRLFQRRDFAATKTYVNSLGAVAMLFAEMGDDATAREELARMPEALAAQIDSRLRRCRPSTDTATPSG